MPVKKQNWAHARKNAINAALRQSVSLQVSRLLEAEGKKIESHRGKIKPILKRSMDYVQSYQLLEEIKDEDSPALTVHLSVGLFNTELTGALYRLGVGSEKISVKTGIVLLIGEKNLERDGRSLPFDEFQPASESMILEIFRENKIEVLDRSLVAGMAHEDSLKKALKGDIKSGIAVGIQCGVEAVVMGTAISRELPPDLKRPDKHTTQVNISLRLIRVDKGSVVGVSSEFAKGYGANRDESEWEAMSKATSKLSDILIKQITSLWKNG